MLRGSLVFKNAADLIAALENAKAVLREHHAVVSRVEVKNSHRPDGKGYQDVKLTFYLLICGERVGCEVQFMLEGMLVSKKLHHLF